MAEYQFESIPPWVLQLSRSPKTIWLLYHVSLHVSWWFSVCLASLIGLTLNWLLLEGTWLTDLYIDCNIITITSCNKPTGAKDVPYSRKLLREKTFENFEVLQLSVKVFSAKILFLPNRESFLPRKFLAIWYVIILSSSDCPCKECMQYRFHEQLDYKTFQNHYKVWSDRSHRENCDQN